MRDLAVFLAMLVFVPMSLSNSFIAYLVWGWTGVIAINEYVYGFMMSAQLNMIFAVITLLLMFAGKDSGRRKFEWTRSTVLLCLWALQSTLCATFAYGNYPQNWEIWSLLVKSLLFCLVMPMMLTTRLRIHAMVVVVVLGLSFHGTVEGAKVISSGGGHIVNGLRKFGDNNHFALVIVMAMPLLIYLLQYSKRLVVRLGAIGGLVFSVAAIVGTHSRGGLVSMVLAGAWLIWSGRRKTLGIVVLAAGAILVVAIAPDSWSERMKTIETAEQDSSFMGRVVAWKISSAIAMSNPMLGGGFHAVERQDVWTRFRDSQGLLGFVETPVPDTRAHAAHSIYFEVLGDQGFVGLAIFVAILANCFIMRREIRKRTRRIGPRLLWASDLSDALSATMFAYVVGAAALSVAYLEVVYVFIMLMESLKQYVIREAPDGATTNAIA